MQLQLLPILHYSGKDSVKSSILISHMNGKPHSLHFGFTFPLHFSTNTRLDLETVENTSYDPQISFFRQILCEPSKIAVNIVIVFQINCT